MAVCTDRKKEAHPLTSLQPVVVMFPVLFGLPSLPRFSVFSFYVSLSRLHLRRPANVGRPLRRQLALYTGFVAATLPQSSLRGLMGAFRDPEASITSIEKWLVRNGSCCRQQAGKGRPAAGQPRLAGVSIDSTPRHSPWVRAISGDDGAL